MDCGLAHDRHLELMLDADFVDVKTRLHVVDGAAVLDRDDAARDEASPVTDAVDFVEDRDLRIAGSKEVRVQGVHAADLDGATRRHQGLGRDLAAEGALALLFGVASAKGVDLDTFEIEQIDKERKGFGHVPLLHLGLMAPRAHGRRGIRLGTRAQTS